MTNKILTLALMAVAIVFASCSKDNGDDPKEPIDYSKDIIGLWEGVSMTGDETYGSAEARLEYYADGTYTYFEKHLGRWCPSENVDNVYSLDGARITHRWCPEEGADYISEWWDIEEIKDSTMKWSAQREHADGSRYTTTFTWKKIDAPTEEQYKTMILGEWRCYEYNSYQLKDDEPIDSTIIKYQEEETYTFNIDSTFGVTHINPDSTSAWEVYGRYEMKGSVITMITDEVIIEGEHFDISKPVTDVYGILYIDKENFSMINYSKSVVPATGEVVYDLSDSKLRRR